VNLLLSDTKVEVGFSSFHISSGLVCPFANKREKEDMRVTKKKYMIEN